MKKILLTAVVSLISITTFAQGFGFGFGGPRGFAPQMQRGFGFGMRQEFKAPGPKAVQPKSQQQKEVMKKPQKQDKKEVFKLPLRKPQVKKQAKKENKQFERRGFGRNFAMPQRGGFGGFGPKRMGPPQMRGERGMRGVRAPQGRRGRGRRF